MEHCCVELAGGCYSYRYGKTLPTLSFHHSTCVIAWADVEPLRNWPVFQVSQNLRGLIEGESDPFRRKEGGALLPRAGRGLL